MKGAEDESKTNLSVVMDTDDTNTGASKVDSDELACNAPTQNVIEDEKVEKKEPRKPRDQCGHCHLFPEDWIQYVASLLSVM